MNLLPAAAKGYVTAALYAAVALAIFGAGWAVNGWRLGAEVAEVKRQHAQALFVASEASGRELARVTAERDRLQEALGGLDAAGLAKLKGDANETERLRACVRDDTCGLRVRASCPTNPAGVPGAAQGGSVDTGAGARLDADVEPHYFTLRGGISRTQTKLATCQAALGCLTGQGACPATTAPPTP
jgi:prophage endopeptidase